MKPKPSRLSQEIQKLSNLVAERQKELDALVDKIEDKIEKGVSPSQSDIRRRKELDELLNSGRKTIDSVTRLQKLMK